MSQKLKSSVPVFRVLAVFVISVDSCLQTIQFWNSEPQVIHKSVTFVGHRVDKFISGDHCTVL